MAYSEPEIAERHLPALRLIHNLSETNSGTELRAIESLELLTNDELLLARSSLGRFGWRLQCAIDHLVVDRVEKLKGGRGNKDDEDKGRNQAIRKQARKINVTPGTIRRNVAIHELIVEASQTDAFDVNSLSILDEKGYFLAALTAADPIGALGIFIQQKSSPKRFRVTDAYRLLSNQDLTTKKVTTKAIAAIRSATREARFVYLKNLYNTLRDCPDDEMSLRLGIGDCLEDVRDELQEMRDADIVTAVKKAWSVDCKSEPDLARATGFQAKDISRLLMLNNDFIRVRNTDPQCWLIAESQEMRK